MNQNTQTRKNVVILSLLIFTILCLCSCKKKEELFKIEEMPVFEETNWGMSPEQALKALGIKKDSCEIEEKENYIFYKIKDYVWQEIPADLRLSFIKVRMSDGKERGLAEVDVCIKEGVKTYEEVLSIISGLYQLEPQKPQERESSESGREKKNNWFINCQDIEKDNYYHELLEEEYKRIGVEAPPAYLSTMIELSQSEYQMIVKDGKWTQEKNGSIRLLMSSSSSAIINHLLAGKK